MRAIQIEKTGGPDVLQLKDLPQPTPAAGQVLVHVEAAGINFIDIYQREGRYPLPLPFVPGSEGAGTVEEVGVGVTEFKRGDRVAWASVRGSYAEYVVAETSALVHVPSNVRMDDAAAVMLQGITAHYLSHDTYAIKAGDTVLVHAGAGGVGLLLTQMAKSLGARVLTTVSTMQKAELSRAAGADRVINYVTESFVEAVKQESGGEGLPVVYDSVGKTTFEDSLKCLRPRGLMVLFGASSGAVPPFDLIRLSQTGSLYVTRPTMGDYIRTRVELERRVRDIFNAIGDGSLTVNIGARYKLEDAQRAHEDLQARKTTGKVLLTL
ncbi:quinone oxidoreductase family protein [Granulicella cerasi]|uniref:Quinone oxidoreductase family protein n=1 Tax=Granulicella cerasi TaxID=741063 RepID=A0ABW1Z665_9BACT|nr:quinone oxidoreductase [Granulicella cerasi]